MAVDFCQLKLKINYNNNANPYLQYGPQAGTKPPEEFQAGWTEVYDMPSPAGPFQSTPNQVITTTAVQAFTFLAARASLLALNYYIFQAEIHQASVYRSSLPLPGSARFGGWDNEGAILSTFPLQVAYASQLCSNAEETVIVRQEAANMRRWERQIRGIKDYVSDDSMTYYPAISWGAGTSTIFDSVFPAVQVPGSAVGTPGTVNFTGGTGGTAISGVSVGAAGSYPWAVAGVYPLSITDPTGAGAYGTFTLTGATGTATMTAVSLTSGGAGYTAPVITAPVSADPGGIALYQSPATLWANFAACLQAYTGSGQHTRVGNAAFPSGYMTQLSTVSPLTGYYPISRVLIQRIGNRQTGQIRLTSPARRRRGI